MKKITTLLAACVIAVLFSNSLYAQTQAVSVDATVLADITFTDVVGLDFGNVLIGSNPTIDADTPANDDDIGTNATIGSFDISAAASTDLSIEYTTTAATISGTTGSIDYTPDVSGNSSDTRTGSTALTGSSGQTGLTTDGSGNYYLFVGGSLDLTSAVAGESYSSSLTITLNYF